MDSASSEEPKLSPVEVGNLAKHLYTLEMKVESVRAEHLLPRLDSTIYSSNILESFKTPPHERRVRDGPRFDWHGALRSIDLQYPLLGFLLKHDEDMRKEEYEVSDLVEGLVAEWKDSFTVADIVRTRTGVTRCKTNIRFAIRDLREAGLIDDSKTKGEGCCPLSYIGLLATYHLNRKPPEGRVSPLSAKPRRFSFSSYHVRLDPFIRDCLKFVAGPKGYIRQARREEKLSDTSVKTLLGYVGWLVRLEGAPMERSELKVFNLKFKKALGAFRADDQIRLETRILAEAFRKELSTSN